MTKTPEILSSFDDHEAWIYYNENGINVQGTWIHYNENGIDGNGSWIYFIISPIYDKI